MMLKIFTILQIFLDELMTVWMEMFASTIVVDSMKCLLRINHVVIYSFVMIAGIIVEISSIVQNANSHKIVLVAPA
jgi:hypothetical protein